MFTKALELENSVYYDFEQLELLKAILNENEIKSNIKYYPIPKWNAV